MKLRIIHKGLAVILIPVFLQLACILWLYVVVEKTERLAASEAAASQVANLLTDMVGDLVSYTRIVTTHFDQQENRVGELSTTSKQVFRTADELHNILVGSKDLVISEQLRNKMVTQLKTSLRYLDRVNARVLALERDRGDTPLAVYKMQTMAVLAPLADGLAAELEAFMTTRNELLASLAQTRAAQAAARAETKSQILIAVAVEIATTIIVSALFLQNIADRLNVLVANAKLIPTDQPLTKKVAGSDELAYLDEVLHTSSTTLRQAAEHKRSLMEMVAHDLRTPLMSATLLVDQLLLQSKKKYDELTSKLQELRNTCGMVTAFVEDLLTVDKLEAGKIDLDWNSVQLSEVLDESLQQALPLAEKKNVTLKSNVESVKVLADRRRVQQVLNNLLSNAIKYSPARSEVTISLQVEEKSVKILVADRGPGIPDDQKPRLFEKFYQGEGDGSGEGFGLGLAICNLIIREHGGAIGVDSKVGQGSTFWFTLPLDKD